MGTFTYIPFLPGVSNLQCQCQRKDEHTLSPHIKTFSADYLILYRKEMRKKVPVAICMCFGVSLKRQGSESKVIISGLSNTGIMNKNFVLYTISSERS